MTTVTAVITLVRPLPLVKVQEVLDSYFERLDYVRAKVREHRRNKANGKVPA